MRTHEEIEHAVWNRLKGWIVDQYGEPLANDIYYAYLDISSNEIRKELKLNKKQK